LREEQHHQTDCRHLPAGARQYPLRQLQLEHAVDVHRLGAAVIDRASQREAAARKAFLALAAGLSRAGDPPLTPVSQESLIERLDDGAKAPYVLDVRTADEYVSGHVQGAVNIPRPQPADPADSNIQPK
jgi:rhodanese-related sulfurtransferase